jgi:hypothetical protein
MSIAMLINISKWFCALIGSGMGDSKVVSFPIMTKGQKKMDLAVTFNFDGSYCVIGQCRDEAERQKVAHLLECTAKSLRMKKDDK